MEHIYTLSSVPFTNQMIYYLIIAIGAIYFFIHFGFNRINILVVLFFWDGLFQFIYNTINVSDSYHKIIVVIFSFSIFAKNITLHKNKNDLLINYSFILFTISFWITYFLYIESEQLVTNLSQFFYKYTLVFLMYHWLKDIEINTNKRIYIHRILLTIISMQVVFSITKILLFGGTLEFIVGSMQYLGGGIAVGFPILALLFYWLYKEGRLKRIDWLLIVSVMLVAIASSKRTPIVLFPIITVLLLIYVKQKKRLSLFLKYVPLIIFIFYLSIKTNVNFNPERSIWGSFDISYVYKQAMMYNFGTDKITEISNQSVGRGGSIFLLISPESLNLNEVKKILFGNGLTATAIQKYGRFLGVNEMGYGGYGIRHVGLMGAATMLAFNLGYLGLLFYIVFVIALLRIIKFNRFRTVVLIYMSIEFFVYYNSTLTSTSLSFLFLIICFSSNLVFNKNVNSIINFYSK